MSNESQYDQDTNRRSKRQQEHAHLDPQEKLEAEVKAFTEDPSRLAREILAMKKELNRLHYKVKSYQQSNRRLQIISSVISLLLLIMIAYRVFLR